jgi:hypothetical protein
MKRILLFLFLFAFSSVLIAQKKIDTNVLSKLLQGYEGQSLLLEDYTIEPYLDPAKGYYDNQVIIEQPLNYFLELYNCKGEIKFVFNHCEKLGNLSFQKCTGLSISIDSSVTSNINIQDSDLNELSINKCSITSGRLNIAKSKVKDFSIVESNYNNLPKDKFLLNIYNSEIQNMILYKSTFNSGSLNLNASQIESSTIVLCNLFQVNFSATNFLKTFAFKRSSIENQIGLQDISFPPNTNFSFENIKDFKIAILTAIQDSVNYTYTGTTDEELEDTYLYNDLLAVYNELFQLYKTRGDLESANAAYVEMKEVQTRFLKFQYKKHPGLKKFLSWKLNSFLKFFCDYGTNPVKSIILSVYTIALFAFFYFIFPSETDNLKKDRLFSKVKSLNFYFYSGDVVRDKSNEKYKAEIKQLEDFKNQLKSTRSNAPVIFNFFTRAFYNTALFYCKFSLWFLNTFYFIGNKPWGQLKSFQKFMTGTLLSLGFLVFVIWGLVMRLVNASLLSLNSFITLGYGEIEAKGISRYLAVVEGAVGWFLLSIFSVSLISQILQ